MAKEQDNPYVLGIDLGVQSVGWSVIDLGDDGEPCKIRRCGVRCFESGVGTETEIELGKDESSNVKRRGARLQRRQFWRRSRRHVKVFNLLRKSGLLPDTPTPTSEQRHQSILDLDAELAAAYLPENDRVLGHLLPYRLRALALDEPLPPFALGRALYHLSQRRGFLSNRKSAVRDDEDPGKVKADIEDLRHKLDESGARTLGEYFSQLDPEEQRIRRRWTGRQMFLDEFEAIWSAQARHHPELLNDDLKERLHRAMFHQRPLKSQKGLIGVCELEPDARRAPWACLEAQRFRYLQRLNDLEIIAPDGELLKPTAEQRAKLIEAFESQAEVTFNGMRTLPGLKVPRGSKTKYTFNLEAGDEKKLKGNVTAARIKKVLGDEYARLDRDKLDMLIHDLLDYEKRDALKKRLTGRYGVSPEKAGKLADVTLEEGYCNLSRKALYKLLPRLEQGVPFATARKEIYGRNAGETPKLDKLPPILEAVPALRNPVVCRGLTELRKVVNALILQYGKPERIHVELARDMKRSRKQRQEMVKKNRDNEKRRDAARKKIQEECGVSDPKPGDILKVRLAEESNWECPYTGKQIHMKTLVGTSPQFDIEHIVPFSRSLDNSFGNKSLCYHEENRNVKGNRTPWEAYSGDDAKYQEITARVRRFRGPAAYGKLRKFQQKELDADFAARQLQDTRYMSRLAAQYLGLLYGQVDPSGKRYVQVSPGRVTAYLRDQWKLNAILADGERDEKNREDHRHHAVDAVAIGLSSVRSVQLLSTAAARAEQIGHRLFVPIDLPWPSFLDDARTAVDAINISCRVNRRVRGALHKETFYSKAHKSLDKKGQAVECRHVRKPLVKMSANEVTAIVDDTVRRLVQRKLEQYGGDPKKVFADENNLPYFKAKDGRIISIRKARIRVRQAVISVGKGSVSRHVKPGRNHHVEIVAIISTDASEGKWEEHVVSLFEAHQRLSSRSPVVRREHGLGKRFIFSLAIDEYVEMEFEAGSRCLYRVVGVSEGDIEFHLHTDARPTNIGGRKRVRIRNADRFRRASARKVTVDPLGNILPAND